MTPDSLRPGSTFANRYRIEKQTGGGGTAIIFRATDAQTRSPIALKVFTNPVFPKRRIHQEAEIQRQLHHPHILALHTSGQFHGADYLDLELAQGNFESFTEQQGKLPIDQAVTAISSAARALSYTHRKGFIHRDPKPSNMLYRSDGSVALSDWGSAIPIPETPDTIRHDERFLFAFTPAYCANEQFFGKPTVQSDIYVLGGLTAYTLFTGIQMTKDQLIEPPPPFEIVLGNDMNVVYEAVEPPIRKAFEKIQSQRQQSMAEYLTELQEGYRKGKEKHHKQRTDITTSSQRNGATTKRKNP